MERYKAYVVPSTPGTFEEVQARAISRREKFLSKIFRRDESLDSSKSRKHPNKLDLSDAKSSTIKSGYLSSVSKIELFRPSVQAIQLLLEEHGIVVPDSLVSRICVVDNETYHKIQLQEQNRMERGSVASTHPHNRLIYINDYYVAEIAYYTKNSYQDMLRNIGIHELGHSLAYDELWILTGENTPPLDRINILRRFGIRTSRVVTDFFLYSTGLTALEEGFIEYFRERVLRLTGEPTVPSPCTEELELVKLLISFTGEEPFYLAEFTKTGFRDLFLAFEKNFGKGALRHFATQIGYDSVHSTENQKNPYEHSKLLIIDY